MQPEKIKQLFRDKYGKELTDKQAVEYIEKYGKLSDNELDNVSGGYNFWESEFWSGKYCEPCGVWCDSKIDPEAKWNKLWICPACGSVYE